jgi:hypothetical protein
LIENLSNIDVKPVPEESALKLSAGCYGVKARSYHIVAEYRTLAASISCIFVA